MTEMFVGRKKEREGLCVWKSGVDFGEFVSVPYREKPPRASRSPDIVLICGPHMYCHVIWAPHEYEVCKSEFRIYLVLFF